MNSLLEEVERRYREGCRLQAVLWELTHACPCDCSHCLLDRRPGGELTLPEIERILAEMAAEGVVNLGLTGGEPLARPDWPEILDLASRHRFFVSILTTGWLVNEAAVDRFLAAGVRSLEISLLGAAPPTHDAIAGRAGAQERALRAARLARAAGLHVCLKATIMRPNAAELPAMARLAADLGVEFSANATVSPRVDGDRGPLAQALCEGELAALDPQLLTGGLLPDETTLGGAVLVCRAGRTVAGLSPTGELFPCVLWRRGVGSLRERSLRDLWRERPDPFLREVRALRPEQVSACLGCRLRAHCPRCPGVAWLETGRLGEASPTACAVARGLAAARGVRP